MRNLFAGWALLLVALVPAGAVAQSIDVIPPTGQWVTDRADMLTLAEEETLSRKLAYYADSTSTQIVVVTLPDLSGSDPALYAVELGRRWGVGQKGSDNGIVILLSREDRTITIQVGYGLEGAIPDVTADRIRRNIMVPQFRQGHFFEGLSIGIDALMQAARGEYTAAERPAPAAGGRGVDFTTLFILAIIGIFVLRAVFGGRRGGGGGGGHRRVRRRVGLPPVIIWGGGGFGGGGGGWGGGGGFGGGGFSGGGGSFGGGGASGNW